jgi:AmmeMemoRadiSam system protein A
MCGVAPVASLIVAARELGATSAELVKYQTSGDSTGDYDAVVGYAGVIFKKAGVDPMIALAKETVERYTRQGKMPPPPRNLSDEMRRKAGVFVSIHKGGALRGCIGTFEPQQPNVAREIIANAVSAATQDPRFPPIAPEELDELDYSVDVLTTPEPIEDVSQLDPRKYGAIVECGWRRGLLLPDLDGVDEVKEQIDICRRKGGIGPDEPVRLYRFEVKRHK